MINWNVLYLFTVHGEWSTWAPWEECSVSCYEGVKKRHRTCTNPAPSLYGHNCIGDPVEFNICNEQPCPGISIFCLISHSYCDVSLSKTLYPSLSTDSTNKVLFRHKRKIIGLDLNNQNIQIKT